MLFFDRFFKKRNIEIDSSNLPSHIAIILDGNGRWAKKRGLSRSLGHREGSKVLKKITGYCDDIGIKYMTVYAFSTENWKRPKNEVNTLMTLLLEYLKNADREMEGRSIRINVIGNIDGLSVDIQNEISRVTKSTEKNTGLSLFIALNYGSRDEIMFAAKEIIKDVTSGRVKSDDITEELLSKKLYTSSIPDPDLLIRPGGEKRISNFLLWQCAYTEFWYTDVLWPDFKEEHIADAIKDYQNRNRRFGGI